MSHSGYTVSPVFNDEGEYLGSEVEGMHSGYQTAPDEFVETATGLRHHYQDVALEDDGEDYYDQKSHFGTVLEAYPGLPDALDWANDSGHWDPHTFDLLEAAIAADDQAAFMPLLESLAEEYAYTLYSGQIDQPVPTEFEEETDAGFTEEQVESLKNVVPGGDSTYQSMLQWAAQYWPEDEISAFDQIMDSGDYDHCQEAIQALYVSWYENNY